MIKDTLTISAPTQISIILHQMGWGGVDRVAVILAKGFAERGIDTELIVCVKGGPGEDDLKRITGDKVKIRFVRKSSGSRGLDFLMSFAAIGRHLRASSPDAILSSGNNTSLFCLFLTWLY